MQPQQNADIRKIIHDIRSNITVIQCYVDASKDFPKPCDMNELLDCAKMALGQLIGHVDALYALARADIKTAQDIIAKNRLAITPEDKTVLLIDDDKNIRTQFKTILSQKGIPVVEMERGEDLLNCSLDMGSITSAIVDYQFENSSLDGFDIIEYLKTQKVGKIHLCTAQHDDPAVQTRARDLGIESIIAKPIPDEIRNWPG